MEAQLKRALILVDWGDFCAALASMTKLKGSREYMDKVTIYFYVGYSSTLL